MIGLLASSALICAISVCKYGVREDSGGRFDLGPVGTFSSVGFMIVYELYAKLFCKLTTPFSVYLT